MFLHIHDRDRRRRTTGRYTQISRGVSACTQGKFHALAYGPDSQFQSHSSAVPDSESTTTK